MTQSTSLVITSNTGVAYRADNNANTRAIITDHEGPSAPVVAFEYMPWRDTAGKIWRRNQANDAWVIEWNYSATIPPTVNNDSSQSYNASNGIFSKWTDTTNFVEYICVNAAIGAAKWIVGGAPAGTDQEWTTGTLTVPRNITPDQLYRYGGQGGGGGTTTYYIPSKTGGGLATDTVVSSDIAVIPNRRIVQYSQPQQPAAGLSVPWPLPAGESIKFLAGLSNGTHLSGFCTNTLSATADISLTYWDGSQWATWGTVRFAASANPNPAVQSGFTADITVAAKGIRFTCPDPQNAALTNFAIAITGEKVGG